jgi:hypothetical protein
MFVVYAVIGALVFISLLLQGLGSGASFPRVIIGALLFAAFWPVGALFHIGLMVYLMITNKA